VVAPTAAREARGITRLARMRRTLQNCNGKWVRSAISHASTPVLTISTAIKTAWTITLLSPVP